MIKLQHLIPEAYKYSPGNIIVGTVDNDGNVIGSEKWLTHGYMVREKPQWMRPRHDWRYNKPKQTLFWWDELKDIPQPLRNSAQEYVNNLGYEVKKEISLDTLASYDDQTDYDKQKYHSHGGLDAMYPRNKRPPLPDKMV